MMARLNYVIPYDPTFLDDGFEVPLLGHNCTKGLLESGRVYDYIHFSLVMHKNRKSALYTAHNVDVAQLKSVSRTGWDLDHRIGTQHQTGPEAYSNNDWDRGHLVRRAAVAWGSGTEAKDASDSTFYYPCASLQHKKFNQDEWLKLEDWVLQKAGGLSSKLCVFTGPIYTKKDLFERGFRIPSAFWKVIVIRDPTANGEDLAVLGFLMKQNEMWDNWNGTTTENLRLYQVGIKEISEYTGLNFKELAILDEFEWRYPRFRNRALMQPIEIDGPEDIEFFGHRRRAAGIRALRSVEHLPSHEHQHGSRHHHHGSETSPQQSGCACAACNDTGGGSCQDLKDQVALLSSQVVVLQNLVETILNNSNLEIDQRTLDGLRDILSRIVGGELVLNNDFEHCALVGNDQQWFCSGVLVHERVVITAAHCAAGIPVTKVYLGGNSVNFIGLFGEVAEVTDVFVHPDYNPHLVPSHDIAVLILAEDSHIKPAILATSVELDNEDNTILVGFGYDHPSLPMGFGTKRKVDVPISNLQGLAKNNITSVENLHGFDNIHELHAGNKGLGKDSCNGDSGGPAYIFTDDTFKVAAVTSRAAHSSIQPCGDGGIYTKIAPYLDWIGQVTGGLVGTVPNDDNTGTDEPTNTAGGLYISAALPNPAGADAGNEWIEITNASATAINLDTYRLADKQGGREPLSGTLAAGKTQRITLANNSPIKLGNNGDEIKLIQNDQIIHEVSYTRADSGVVITFAAPENLGDVGGGGDNLFEADPC